MKAHDTSNGIAAKNEGDGRKKRGRKKVKKDAIAMDGMNNSHAVRSSTQNDFLLEVQTFLLQIEYDFMLQTSTSQDAEDPSVCEACLDGTVYEDNEILFCDKCNVAVHQNCYSISSIPEGPW